MTLFPFVTKSHHEEVVAELRLQRDRAEEEKRKILDLFTFRATGQKVFYPDPEPEVEKEEIDERELTPLQRAKRKLGPRANVRQALNQIQKDNDREFKRERSTSPDISIAPRDAEMELDAVLDSGRAAASSKA